MCVCAQRVLCFYLVYVSYEPLGYHHLPSTDGLGVGSLFSCSVCQFFYSTLSYKNITTGVMANTRIIFLGIVTVLLNPWIEKILYVVSWLLRTLDLLQTHPENNLCNLSGQLLLIACSEMVDKDKSCTVTDQQCAIQEL